jgi:hypothetical protein
MEGEWILGGHHRLISLRHLFLVFFLTSKVTSCRQLRPLASKQVLQKGRQCSLALVAPYLHRRAVVLWVAELVCYQALCSDAVVGAASSLGFRFYLTAFASFFVRKIMAAICFLRGMEPRMAFERGRVVAAFWLGGVADALPITESCLCQDLVRAGRLAFVFPFEVGLLAILNVRLSAVGLPVVPWLLCRKADYWVGLWSLTDFCLFGSLVRLFQKHLLLLFRHKTLLLLRWGWSMLLDLITGSEDVERGWCKGCLPFLVGGYFQARAGWIMDQFTIQILLKLITF